MNRMRINRLVKDDKVSLDAMVLKLNHEYITTQEWIREWLCRAIRKSYPVTTVLQAIELNVNAEYFYFDYTSETRWEPKPIYNKEDILNYI